MKVETKFNPNDKVWFIKNSKAIHAPIDSIKILVDNKNVLKIENFINSGTKEKYECSIVEDQFCFKTRQELIDNL